MIPKDEVRLESELNSKELSASEGQAFLETVLEELATCGRDSALYRQCVDTTDEFEPLFVHHALLRAAEYNIVDLATYVQHTEQLAQTGIIESLYEVTRDQYKSRLWVEVQYMRIRCSMMHLIINRKSAEDDDQIFNMMFCKGRDKNNGLSMFSFSSGTSTMMQAEERLRPTEFFATHVYSPSSSGYTRGMLSVAFVPSKDIT